MDWVWEHSQAGGLARFALVAIADKARGPECKAYASLTFLQGRLGVTRPTVVSALRDLHELGELETVVGEKGPYGASVYRIPKAQGHARATPESVNGFYRSADPSNAGNGKGDVPIEPGEAEATGKSGEPIGAEADEIGKPALPIEPAGAGRIGKNALPIPGEAEAPIGQAALPIGAQIGKAAEPLHQRTHQEEIELPLSAVPAPPKKRTRRRTQDPRVTAGLARFAEFFAIYPLSANEAKAKTQWDRAIKDGADPDVVINGAKRYAAEREGQDETYTAFASNWLKDKRWNDKPRQQRPQSGAPAPYRNDPNKDYGRGFPGAVTTYEGD